MSTLIQNFHLAAPALAWLGMGFVGIVLAGIAIMPIMKHLDEKGVL